MESESVQLVATVAQHETIVELTAGDLKLEQLFAIAEGDWAAEWERALLGRNVAAALRLI